MRIVRVPALESDLNQCQLCGRSSIFEWMSPEEDEDPRYFKGIRVRISCEGWDCLTESHFIAASFPIEAAVYKWNRGDEVLALFERDPRGPLPEECPTCGDTQKITKRMEREQAVYRVECQSCGRGYGFGENSIRSAVTTWNYQRFEPFHRCDRVR